MRTSMVLRILPAMVSSMPRSARVFCTASAATPTPPTTTAFDQLASKLQQITRLQRLSAIANWDQLVMMPDSEANHAERGAQLAALASVIHSQATSEDMGLLIDQAKAEGTPPDARDAAVLREAARDYERQKMLSAELAERQAALSSEAYGVWAKAREANDFEAFAPTLAKCFATAREVAECRSPGGDAYDESLQEFERGMSGDRIDGIFAAARERLAPLLRACLDSPTQPSTAPLRSTDGAAPFPVEKQRELSSTIVGALGLAMQSNCRLDLSVHPFSTSFGPGDVRITTRFDTNEWYQGLAGSIHEAGHSMYEAGLRPSALPVDRAVSMGVHESQSLFWERHIGLSRPFWSWAGPQVRESLGVTASDDELYAACNAVSPESLIRVEADELSYPMHVILRFEIERALLRGELEVADVPAKWNAAMSELLGATPPPTHRAACRTCTGRRSRSATSFVLLGAMMAAQLDHHARLALPDMDDLIARGEFAPILAWLREKVHDKGVVHPSMDELLLSAVGEPLEPRYFIEHLERKYSALYGLKDLA